jgi:phage terminase large subunit
VAHPPADAIDIEVGWADNPWISPELIAEKDFLYRVDPEAAEHVWGGKTRQNTNANVLRGRYRIESFEPEPGWDGPYFGADWGFSEDPTTLVKLWINGRTLYVEHEAYGIGVDTDKIPALFDKVPGAREHEIRADNARPETISYVRQDHEIGGKIIRGYPRLVGATKGPGSLEDGVEHLRSYEAIVIHPRCIHTAEEARLYSFKVDRLSGQVMSDIVDAHNHCLDAARYGLEPVMKSRKVGDIAAGLAQGSQVSYWNSLGNDSDAPHLSGADILLR